MGWQYDVKYHMYDKWDFYDTWYLLWYTGLLTNCQQNISNGLK